MINIKNEIDTLFAIFNIEFLLCIILEAKFSEYNARWPKSNNRPILYGTLSFSFLIKVY